MLYPHGPCECTRCGNCSVTAGPAAYEIERDGRRIRVCTRCNTSDGTNRRLLVTPGDNAALFTQWDAMGAMLILADLREAAERESAQKLGINMFGQGAKA